MCHHRPHRQHHDTTTLTARSDPLRRLSPADSERALDQLRRHAGEGRISLEEFGERVGIVLEARTAGELASGLAGLPVVTNPVERRQRSRRALLDAAGPFLAVMALLVSIWLVTGAGYFWPIWPTLGWGIPVFLGLRHELHRDAMHGAGRAAA